MALPHDVARLQQMLLIERQKSEALQKQVIELKQLLEEARSSADSKKIKKKGTSKKPVLKLAMASWTDKKRETLHTKQDVMRCLSSLGATIAKGILNYSCLNLSGKSISKEAAAHISVIVSQLQGIHVVDFHDIIAGQLREDVVLILRQLCEAISHQTFTTLNLSDNALGVQGVRACEAAFKNSTHLRHLYFNNDGLEGDAGALITKLVLSVHPSGKSQLRTFEIHNNLLQDEGAINLAPLFENSPDLRHLRFSTTRTKRPGAEVLVKALKNCRKFVWLELADFAMGKVAGGHLAEVLSYQPDLRHLSLSETFLEKSELGAILSALSGTAPNLEVLKLSGLDITGEMVRSMVIPLIVQKPLLRELDLAHNDLGVLGAVEIALALKDSKTMQHLNLGFNRITIKAVMHICQYLCVKPSLTHLDLNGNWIHQSGIELIRVARKKAGHPTDFTWSDNEDDGDMEGGDESSDIQQVMDSLKRISV
eukprot:gb/GEZN01005223.1/.p1 GENE.gb/GEZN01005223.1/~~gb/GEZN01005223.1/.p1  ORF type:complete len:499 (-),score=63.04 gb/GEZN01005223.1/:337-1779(-)